MCLPPRINCPIADLIKLPLCHIAAFNPYQAAILNDIIVLLGGIYDFQGPIYSKSKPQEKHMFIIQKEPTFERQVRFSDSAARTKNPFLVALFQCWL